MDAGAAPQAAGAGPGPSASEDRLTTDQDATRALSLMPEAVVCRRDDAAFFFLPRARRPDADAYRAAARRDQPRRLSAFRWLSSPVPAGRMQAPPRSG
jgi:hypothetical protein